MSAGVPKVNESKQVRSDSPPSAKVGILGLLFFSLLTQSYILHSPLQIPKAVPRISVSLKEGGK